MKNEMIDKKMADILVRNLPSVISGFAVAGVIITSVLVAKSTPKAVELIKADSRKKHDGDPYAYTKKEAIKSAWTCYIPAFVSGTLTIGCIIGSNYLSYRNQAGLVSAYKLLNDYYKDYRNEVIKRYGKEVDNDICDSIIREHCKPPYIYSMGFLGEITQDFNTSEPEIERTFYDSFSKRYFNSTISNVLQAEYALNRNYISCEWPTLNEFYSFLGLSPVDGGDEIGWSYDLYSGGICWVDFNHRVTTLDDGMEICIIDFYFAPDVMTEM